MKIMLVAGARPNFMKLAPIMREIKKRRNMRAVLVHTGQHYDRDLSERFFADLGIRKPDYNLKVGSASTATQTANIMLKLEKVLLREKPEMVVVIGDVNSAIAGALDAAKLHIRVAHVEAGLRSGNWRMSEEVNRVLTDHCSDMLFTHCEEANKNLLREGIPKSKIFFAGNTVIDTLLGNRKRAEKSRIMESFGLESKGFALLTLHRAENVDNKESLLKIVSAIQEIQRGTKIIFPLHPRTRKMLRRFGLLKKVREMENLTVCRPLGYLDFVCLEINAKIILTDSGGIQEEATVLGIPCVTIRNETERRITAEKGTNIVAGTARKSILIAFNKAIKSRPKPSRLKGWDGKASKRIVRAIESRLRKLRGK